MKKRHMEGTMILEFTFAFDYGSDFFLIFILNGLSDSVL